MSELDEALSNPLKRAKRSGNVLAKIFWKTVYFYDIGPRQWGQLMRKYTFNRYIVPEQTVARRSETKNNLVTALLNHTPTFMQWQRGMRMLDIRRIDFCITLYRGPEMEELVIEESVTFPNTGSDVDIDDEVKGEKDGTGNKTESEHSDT